MEKVKDIKLLPNEVHFLKQLLEEKVHDLHAEEMLCSVNNINAQMRNVQTVNSLVEAGAILKKLGSGTFNTDVIIVNDMGSVREKKIELREKHNNTHFTDISQILTDHSVLSCHGGKAIFEVLDVLGNTRKKLILTKDYSEFIYIPKNATISIDLKYFDGNDIEDLLQAVELEKKLQTQIKREIDKTEGVGW